MMWKRIYQLLLPEERSKGLRMVGWVFVSSLLDYAGIALMIPLLYLVLEKGAEASTLLGWCVLLALFVVLKGALMTLFARKQQAFLLGLYRRMSESLFAAYYDRGLEFIRGQGVSKLNQEINYVCFAFSQQLLSPLLRMTSDGLLLFLVTVSLLVYDPKSILVLYGAFLPFVVAYIGLIKGRMERYGKEELQAKREQAILVADTLKGYLEMETYGGFPWVRERFRERMERISACRMNLLTIYKVPLMLSELAVVVGIMLLVLLEGAHVKVMMGAFAVIALRLLPALRNLLSGWMELKHTKFCLDILEKGLEVREKAVATEDALLFKRELTLEGVWFAYADHEPVLKEVNTRIAKGETIGIAGMSGTGKTTLLHLLTGMLLPTKGRICIDGQVLLEGNRRAWLEQIGYVPQEVYIFNRTVAENIALDREVDRERMMELLRVLKLEGWLEGLPEGLDTVLSEDGKSLSGGQRQRMGIARALYKSKEVLLMDEATSALDRETEEAIHETLRELKEQYKDLTLLYISHQRESLDFCDRIWEVKDTIYETEV